MTDRFKPIGGSDSGARAIQPATVAPDGTVPVVFVTENPVRMHTWDENYNRVYYDEILVCTPEAVDLSRLDAGILPLLDYHFALGGRALSNGIGKALPQSAEFGTDANGVAMVGCRVAFSPLAADADSVARVKTGLTKGASVGYRVLEWEKTIPADGGVQTWRATRWQPYEITACNVPEDPSTGFRTLHDKQNDNESGNGNPEDEEVRAMNRTLAILDMAKELGIDANSAGVRALITDVSVSLEDCRVKLTATKADEGTRAIAILDCAKDLGFASDDTKVRALIADGTQTVDGARAALIKQYADSKNVNPTIAPLRVDMDGTRTAAAKAADAVQDAIAHRYGVTDKADDSNNYRGMGLTRMLCTYADAVGIRTVRREDRDILRDVMRYRSANDGAQSTSDFTKLLANVAFIALRKKYPTVQATYEAWCGRTTNDTLEAKHMVKLSGVGVLQDILEGENYPHSTMADSDETIAPTKAGLMVGFTLEALLNDRLGGLFERAVPSLAAASKRKRSNVVYNALFANAALLEDNIALFHASHKNLLTAGAPTPANVTLGIEAMFLQTDSNGEELELVPKFIISGVSQRNRIQKWLSKDWKATKTDDIVTGDVANLIHVCDPRVDRSSTPNGWYLAADPDAIDTMVTTTLKGQPEPVISSKEDFDTDQVFFKIQDFFGAVPVDFRGLQYNPNNA